MIILLEGTDSFLAHQAIKKIKDQYYTKNPSGVELIELDSESAQINWADLLTVPLFAQSRVIIVKRAGRLPLAEQGLLHESLRQLPTSTIAVIWPEKALDTKGPLATFLSKPDRSVAVETPTGRSLDQWISKEANNRNVVLTNEQATELAQAFPGDLWGLTTELDHYQLSGAATSELQTALATEPFIYFRLVRAKQWSQVAEQISQDITQGLAPELILGGLGAAIRGTTMDRNEKRRLVDLLLTTDLAIKTGLAEAETALALLIATLPKTAVPSVQWEELWESGI